MRLGPFPTDVGGTPTIHGAIHLIVATFAFLGGVLGELALSRSLRNNPLMKGVGNYAVVIAVVALASLAALFLGPSAAPAVFQSISGLVERVFIGLVLAWMFVVSASLLSLRAEEIRAS